MWGAMTAKDAIQQNELCLEGELTVQRAAELRQLLMQALEGSNSIEIDLDRVTGIDLACLQMFCSVRKTAIRDGKQCSVKNTADSVFQKAGEIAGFDYQLKCGVCREAGCLWGGGIHNG